MTTDKWRKRREYKQPNALCVPHELITEKLTRVGDGGGGGGGGSGVQGISLRTRARPSARAADPVDVGAVTASRRRIAVLTAPPLSSPTAVRAV